MGIVAILPNIINDSAECGLASNPIGNILKTSHFQVTGLENYRTLDLEPSTYCIGLVVSHNKPCDPHVQARILVRPFNMGHIVADTIQTLSHSPSNEVLLIERLWGYIAEGLVLETTRNWILDGNA